MKIVKTNLEKINQYDYKGTVTVEINWNLLFDLNSRLGQSLHSNDFSAHDKIQTVHMIDEIDAVQKEAIELERKGK